MHSVVPQNIRPDVPQKNRQNPPSSKLPKNAYRMTVLAMTIAAMGSTSSLLSAPTLAAEQVENKESARKNYAIAPGPMASALNEFASLAGITLSFNPSDMQAVRSSGLQGNYSIGEALRQLLSGSQMSARRTNSGAYMVMPDGANAVPALPTVKVSAGPDLTEVENTISYAREQLEKIAPLDLKDVFKGDAVASVGGSISTNQKVYIRGVEETTMAVTIDGARQNNKVFHHNATNLIDPSLLKEVRASAGISPADDGPGAIGGSIVYETVDVADVLAPDDNFGGFANAGYRSNGDIITTNGSVMGRVEGFEWLGYINRNTGSDYDDGNSKRVRFTEPALTSGLAKLAYQTTSSGRFELSHEVTNDDAARPYRANLIAVQGRPVPESRNYELTRSNTVFQFDNATGRGWWNPNITLADSETEVVTTEVPLADPTSRIVYTGITASTSAKFENTFHTDFAAINAGMDYYDDSAIFKYATDPTLEEKAENVGLFMQFRQDLGKRVDLSYGVRYDDQTFTGTDGTQFDEQGSSANISGDLQLSPYMSINAGYAKVWGGVALGENYILNGAWDYSAAILPVESDNYSLGIKTQLSGFLFAANVFETDIKNGRTPVWRDGPNIVANFLIEGFDTSVGYIGEWGEITLAYADIDSQKNGGIASSYDGNYFTVPLGKLITFGTEVNFHNSRVQIGLNGEKALENKAVAQNGRAQNEYLVLNAYANYQLGKNVTLRIFADNLADKTYVDRATYGQEFTDVVAMNEPGRSVGMNVRVAF